MEAFRARVTELGGSVIEPVWLGAKTPHRVRCVAGHDCAPRPASVRQGKGLCRLCVNGSIEAETLFRKLVAEFGGLVIEPVWLGSLVPHRVQCAFGHDCMPRPNDLQQGQGPCRTCAGKDPDHAERTFRALITTHGGVVVEPVWLGNHTPHRVVCKAGHNCLTNPANVKSGAGFCQTCAGREWNVFYIVENTQSLRIKFGITFGDPARRLKVHRAAGYRSVIRVLTGLPGDTARAIERRVLSTLKLARECPVSGREYFGAHVLTTVLDIVDHYPITNRKDQVSC